VTSYADFLCIEAGDIGAGSKITVPGLII
jgi:hypothetical protein